MNCASQRFSAIKKTGADEIAKINNMQVSESNLGKRKAEVVCFPSGKGLLEAFPDNTVESLKLANTCLANEGARVLATLVEGMPRLRRLELPENVIGFTRKIHPGPTPGMEALIIAVLESKIIYLDLMDNEIAEHDWSLVVKLMRKSQSLQVLRVGNNNELWRETLPELIQALDKTQIPVICLSGLDFQMWREHEDDADYSEFREDDPVRVIKAMRNNDSTEVLDISGVRLSENTLVDALLYVLEVNKTLRTIHVNMVDNLLVYDEERRTRVEARMPRPFSVKYGPWREEAKSVASVEDAGERAFERE